LVAPPTARSRDRAAAQHVVEQRILRRAVDQGLISEGELAALADAGADAATGRWGPRIERLLDDGRLDEIGVAALAEAVGVTAAAVEIAATLDAPGGLGIDPAQLRGWDRYQIIAPVGAGGGGEVFRAHDARLARDVALKFLHADRADLAARFRREAQAQARIEHVHVCKVFEVGEVAGRSFIAMQYIDGATLAAAAAGMSVEERVRVVAQVADAVHAAHRLGIVHRDLKPGNVLVERDSDGAWKPWVVDFGLARELAGSDATTSAAVVGTPAFMAPEQAQGAAGHIDRRTDVYGLGATLFAILAGRAPFVGTSVEVMVQVVSREAPPLRTVVPNMPADLQTIVAKAMDRDPDRRYDSARALAEDLERFLDGEPILARPRPWRERIARRLRRNRALVAVSVVAAASLAGGGVLWLRAAGRAREEARLAEHFGQEAQAIESLMRVAHLMPAHDIRPDRAQVRDRMRVLAAAMADAGDAAVGPGEYALGRGELALGDLGAARAHLERAWRAGDRAPEVAYALGQVLGEQYERALLDATAIEVPEARAARRTAAAAELRDPALVYLQAGKGAETEAPAFVEGLIAFREGHLDDALARLAEAQRKVPSLYEARRLAGDIYTDQAHARGEAGDADGEVELAAKAALAYRDAAAIARSDERVQIGECERTFELIVLDWERGQALDRTADDAVAACERALAIDPDSVDAYREEAAVLLRVGEGLAERGEDPRATLARAVARASAGLARDPHDARTLTSLGTAWLVQADAYEQRHGIDPRPSLAHAIDSFEESIANHPNPHALMNLGMAHSDLADWDAGHGGDPRPAWDRAAAAYRRAIALSPRSADAYLDLGTVFGSRAQYEVDHGIDPRASVAEDIAAQEQAIALKPTHPMAWLDLGAAWSIRADWERASGLECRTSVDHDIAAYKKALELKPDYVYGYDNLAAADRLLGQQQLDRGLDPTEFVVAGRAILDAGAKFNGADAYNFRYRATLELLAARFASHGAGAAARFAAADAAIARALELDPESADAQVVAAEVQRWRAEARVSRHEPATAEIARGLAAAARALKINPDQATAHAVRGALLALAGQPVDARAANHRALELDPLLARDYPPPR
jgi:serine/threonine-protein kinase